MTWITWTLVLFLVWLGLTNSFDLQELLAGAVVSMAVARFAVPALKSGEGEGFSLVGYLLYVPLFMKTLVVSNLDVARRVLDPKLPINPGVVRIRTGLTKPYQRLILANSITLTPGTVTLDMDGEWMEVHWLDVTTEDPEEAGERIKGAMERAIEKI